MAKIIGVVLVSFLLAGPHVADAACAWVLWAKVDDSSGKPLWAVVGGFPSNKIVGPDKSIELDTGWTACMKERAEIARDMLSDENKQLMLKYGLRAPHSVCLPETIDPREPKGASR